jgi:hypothetical protein
MEGVLKKRGTGLVPRNGGWYGVTLTVRDREITDLEVIQKAGLPELREAFPQGRYGVAVDNGSAYLFNLTFPFSDKRKIKLVIGSELEERLPIPVEDLAIDFVETTKGNILAAGIPKSLAEAIAEDKRVRITTVQAIAVLHALKWLNLIYREDFVFIHRNGSAIIIMGFKADRLHYLRQFFHAAGSDSLEEAMAEIAGDRTFDHAAYVMVSDGEDGQATKEYLERKFNIHIDTPSLRKILKDDSAFDWLWPAIGAALLSCAPRGKLNLTGTGRADLLLYTKTALYASICLACVGLLATGLLFLDYLFKESAYKYLVSEQGRIYRLSFPKSPPVKEPAKMFREKIKLLEREPGSVQAAANPLAVLNEISSRIGPEVDVKVNEFASDEKEFTISGTTTSFASVEKIKTSLSQMKGVSQIEMQNLDLAPGRQVKFKIRGRL